MEYCHAKTAAVRPTNRRRQDCCPGSRRASVNECRYKGRRRTARNHAGAYEVRYAHQAKMYDQTTNTRTTMVPTQETTLVENAMPVRATARPCNPLLHPNPIHVTDLTSTGRCIQPKAISCSGRYDDSLIAESPNDTRAFCSTERTRAHNDPNCGAG